MNYMQKVLNYYEFSTVMTVQFRSSSKSTKKLNTINITGRPTKRTIIFYLIPISLIMFISYAASPHPSKIILTIISIILVIFKSKKRYSKLEPQPQNLNIYQRELPSSLKPAHVRMLLKDGLIDNTSIAATLLDLIDKGYISLSKTQSKLDLFKQEDIVLTKTNKDQSHLLQYEKFLINWFFDRLGKRSITSSELRKFLSDNQTQVSSEMFQQFQALTMISFPLQKYYNRKKSNKQKLYLIMSGISLILWETIIGPSFFSYFLGLGYFASPKYLFNQKGIEEEDKWNDLKKYLTDFSDIKNKTSEMVILWEYYLTYSIALDINSSASKEIEDFFGTEIYRDLPFEENNKQINVKNTEQENLEIERNIKIELQKYEQIIGLK